MMGSTLSSSLSDGSRAYVTSTNTACDYSAGDFVYARWDGDGTVNIEPIATPIAYVDSPPIETKKSKEEIEKEELLNLIDDLEKNFKEHMNNYSRKNRKRMIKWYGKRMFQ